MRSIKMDTEGVSPVVATLLMISITVTLAGTVFLTASYYQSMAEGEPEIFVVDVDIQEDGLEEIYGDGGPTGHTYSSLSVSSTHRTIKWERYKVMIDGERVFTVTSRQLTANQVPDASDDPGPTNSGRTSPGMVQYFTEEGYRDDFRPLETGKTYHVVIVNINEQNVVWMGDVTAS